MSSFEPSISSFDGSPEERFARRLKTRLDLVDEAVQSVVEYAQRKARRLSSMLGRDEEYFLSLMFDWGSFLHPMERLPESNPLDSLSRGPGSSLLKVTELHSS